MDKKEFKELIRECGFKDYADLSNFLNIHTQTIVYWNKDKKYPSYLKPLLEWYILVRMFEKNSLTLEELEEENQKLESELNTFKGEIDAKNQ